MKFLFVHEVAYQNKVAYEMHEFPELLALLGHDVTFVEFPEGSTRRLTFKDMFRSRVEIINGRVYPSAKINLVTPPSFGGHLLERLLASFISMPTIFMQLKQNFDAVIVYSVPTTGWQTIWLANRLNVPSVFRALDVSHRLRRTVFSSLIKAAEKYIYKSATILSANNPELLRYCLDLSQRKGPSVVTLPPVDLEHFYETSPFSREMFGIGANEKVIVYMGTFFRFSGLLEVIEEFKHIHDTSPQLRLLLVGGGELENEMRDLVSKLDLAASVIFTGVIDYSILPSVIKIADVAINPFEENLITSCALPHKVFQYMASGIPTVSSSLKGIRGVLGEHSGVTWANGPKNVINTAVNLSELSSDELTSIAKLQKEKTLELFMAGKAETEFLDVIQQAVSK